MGVMVNEELCQKVVEVRIVKDRVMEVVVVFEEHALRLICRYYAQSGRKVFWG